MRPELVSRSKFLSLVLRHKPEAIGLTLDANGWASVNSLIALANAQGICGTEPFNRDILEEIVNTNEKKRFAFSEDKQMIRAVQGHSLKVDLGLSPEVPPDVLYHGTSIKFLDAIRSTGLEKKGRQFVHLSLNYETAYKVGSRHGKPVVLVIDSKKMDEAGYLFYLSENGVWMTDKVPKEFIKNIGNRALDLSIVKEAFAALTDEQRAEITGDYCKSCWKKDPHCQCNNEE
jgi:putative RNA 2'-phosphotransferase